MTSISGRPAPSGPRRTLPRTHYRRRGGPGRGPGRPRTGSEDKRERILAEAVTIFGTHGYWGTTLAQVARAAEISKAGLLHYFPSKDALFAEVLQRRDAEDVIAFLATEGEDPWIFLDQWLDIMERNVRHREFVAVYTAMTPTVLDATHPGHAWMAGHLAETIRLIEQSFERGKRKGLVRAEMPSRMVARTLTALSDGLQIQWLCATTPDTAAGAEVATGMVEEIRLYVDTVRDQWSLRA